ncbi:hypothetical protein BS47DRAFT_1348265 [Hydnum rufescens UP504]|uniref:Uncharacterized protein n=1 Tax=Hydnum rufescens UP504 TaxID=1448309 RepID=A0A9P6AQT9_9AGAM|nr:hypothetical protein BS47DRAFT_1348265 [Hydnum rufescens UP504]
MTIEKAPNSSPVMSIGGFATGNVRIDNSRIFADHDLPIAHLLSRLGKREPRQHAELMPQAPSGFEMGKNKSLAKISRPGKSKKIREIDRIG